MLKNRFLRVLAPIALVLGLTYGAVTPAVAQSVERSARTLYALTVQTVAKFADGTAEAPGIAFATNPTLGLFKQATNSIGVAFAGVEGIRLTGNDIRILSNSASVMLGASQDTIVTRDAANTLAQRNGTSAQTFRLYNTYTSGSNFENLELTFSSNEARIFTTTTGGTLRSLQIRGNELRFGSNGAHRWTVDSNGHFVAANDNSYDIGASGATRPRTGYFGTSVIAPMLQSSSNTVAQLATCNTGAKGARDFVTDATATTFLSTVAGGGANNVPVVCDGTNWVIG